MFRILVVCTANICRSPAAAALLSRELADRPVAVHSAGVAAQAGQPACDLSSALVGEFVAREYGGTTDSELSVVESSTDGPADRGVTPLGRHRSRLVDAEMLSDAGLILALDRSHRAELARVDPASRARTFTLRQAAGLSDVVSGYTAAGQMPPGAPAVPEDPAARLTWWVAELDAARGTAPVTPDAEPHETPLSWHPDDVPDPHVLGYQIHPAAIELIEEGILRISSGIIQALAFAAAEDSPRGHVD